MAITYLKIAHFNKTLSNKFHEFQENVANRKMTTHSEVRQTLKSGEHGGHEMEPTRLIHLPE